MSEAKPVRERPMSPFMIGPYYKPQLTSMLSIAHRGTGVLLALGGLLLTWWLFALAAGPAAYQTFAACAGGLIGRLVIAALVFSLVYHWLNGIRHLLWDVGWGFELPRAYLSGWTVLALATLGSVVVWYYAFAQGGGS
jgi:succinate dehydrogenase / fumarate reductase cytochrome b subunit